MKRTVRSACVAVLLLLALAVAGAPAHAKGPTDVKVSGPGVDTRLSYRSDAGEVDLETLSQAARVYDVLGSPRLARTPGLDRAELGPRYVLRWNAGGAPLLEQHAYPFAEGGAWVRFLPTGSGWGSGVSGWARAGALTDQFVALRAGAEPPAKPTEQAAVATPDVSAAPTAPAGSTESEPAGRSPYDVVVPAGLAAVVVLGAAVLLARRRLLSR